MAADVRCTGCSSYRVQVYDSCFDAGGSARCYALVALNWAQLPVLLMLAWYGKRVADEFNTRLHRIFRYDDLVLSGSQQLRVFVR